MKSASKPFRHQRRVHPRPASFGEKPLVWTRGWIPSPKLKRLVRYAHHIEADFVTLLEADPEVLLYEDRPEKTAIRGDMDAFWYQPHFLVTSATGREAIELVEDDQPRTEERRLVELIERHYERQCIDFRCVTRSRIRAEPRYSNAWKIARFTATVPTEIELTQIHELLRDGPRSFAQTVSAFTAAETECPHALLFAMLRVGAIATSPDRLIDDDSLLWLKDGGGGQ